MVNDKNKMNMRIFQTLVLLFISVASFAQYSDRESLGWYTATAYPEIPVEIGVKTYAITVDGQKPKQGSPFYNFDLKTKKFKYVNDAANADIVASFSNVRVDEPIELLSNIDTKVIKTHENGIKIKGVEIGGKDKKTVVKVGENYKAICNKTVSCDFTLSVDGKVVHEESFSKKAKIESAWYPNPNQAEDSLKVKLKSINLSHLVPPANSVSAELLGDGYLIFGGVSKYHCYKIKSTKKNKYDYTEINAAVDKLMNAFANVENSDWNTQPFVDACAGIVDVFENELKNSNLTDKKARVNDEVTCALNYDIALYYLLSKDFDTAKLYFKKVIDINPKFGRAKVLLNEMPKCQKAKDKYQLIINN